MIVREYLNTAPKIENVNMTVSEIYNQIGAKLLEALQEKSWMVAFVSIERVDKMVGFSCYYLDENEERQGVSVKYGYHDSKAVHELYRNSTEGGNNRWNKLLFRVDLDGTFNVKFIWDQEYQDSIEIES